MKKLWCIVFILLLTFSSGCETQKESKKTIVSEEFTINSINWGSSWESVMNEPQLKKCKIVTDDGNRFVTELDNFEYLGQKGTLKMLFSNEESSFPASGLIQAYFKYDDGAEKEIIKEAEKIYGERKDFFLDKNGVENPLNPPAWYSVETLEGSLTETEKQEYLKLFENKNYDETRIDALLRTPLVIITLDEENNTIRFQGNEAAVAENLKK